MSWKNVLSKEQILNIARRDKMIFVSWRYRDAGIMTNCKQLVQSGCLKEIYPRRPGSNKFEIADEERIVEWRRELKEKKEARGSSNPISTRVKAAKAVSKARQAGIDSV